MTSARDNLLDDDRVARAWLSYHEAEQDCDFWAVERLLQLLSTEPQRAWNIVLGINSLTVAHPLREYLNGVISAGPLEELIHMHGKWLIGQIEEQASKDRRLREQLGHVYLRGDLDADIRERLIKTLDPQCSCHL